MMKYYSCDQLDEELVYDLEYFRELLDDRDIDEPVVLKEMRRDVGGPMWCNKLREFTCGCCGVDCEDYNPCNGKSGCCRYLENGFVETGQSFVLTNDGLK